MTIGIIGYGSMGSMLLTSFINLGGQKAADFIVTGKDTTALPALKEAFPEINIVATNKELAPQCDKIFVCVEPLHLKEVLTEIKDSIKKDAHLISIAGAGNIEDIENIIGGKVTRIIPTLISQIGEGITLVSHNSQVTTQEQTELANLLSSLGKVQILTEKDIQLAIQLTSCAPALIAEIFQSMTEAAVEQSDNLSAEEIEQMILQTVYGTAKLLLTKDMSFQETINRVCTKGGITYEGYAVLKQQLPAVFQQMMTACSDKYQSITQVVSDSFK